MCLIKCLSVVAFTTVLACPLHPGVAKPMFTIFDPPESVATDATSINAAGTIAGYFWDENGLAHGFIRATDGTVTVFDPAGSTSTYVYGINAAGTAVGRYTDAGGNHCFSRTPGGSFTSFDFPKGGLDCYALGINSKGEISGYEYESRHDAYGFLRKQGGAIRTVRHADSYTAPASINDAGTAAGTTAGDGAPQGFVRARNGSLTIFDAPGEVNGTTASSVNSKGSITGYYVDGASADHSYVRAPAGAITEFDPPGATASQSVGINEKGQITGFYFGAGAYPGFVRSPAGTFATFAAPGAIATYPFAINRTGAVTGYYIDSNNDSHGFLWAP